MVGQRRAKHHLRTSLEFDVNGTVQAVPASPSTSSASSADGVCSADGPGGAVDQPPPQQTKQAVPPAPGHRHHHRQRPAEEERITRQEWGNMALLVLLYALQGIPLGLTTGAMPFLLQAKLSMTQMGLFSMSGYPYSFKLLWSPIVDSVYSASLGRRKSWIVPVQLASACLLVLSAGWIQGRYEEGAVAPLTALFFFFVLLAATQDIAVDGWALTLLPPHHIEYASTCQTLGMNTGYFTSFTVFLALSNPEFCNTYVRGGALGGALGLRPSPEPLVTLRGYVAFWGWAFAAVTAAIWLFKREEERSPEEGVAPAPGGQQRRRLDGRPDARPGAGEAGGKGGGGGGDWARRRSELSAAYVQLWEVVRLPAIWGLSFLLLTYRLGVLPAESAASLKLLDKGVAKEALAALVLAQFPVELASAVIAGRWASNSSPYRPFVAGYFVRLAMAVVLTALARAFPAGASSFSSHGSWFAALSLVGLVTSFSSTLMFTALGSFFNRISDPEMGGAYLTLLNTIANMGVILPKTPLYALMDQLTVSTCRAAVEGGGPGAALAGLACPKKLRELAGSNACTDAGHTCTLDSDGFYVVSYSMAALGLALGVLYCRLFPRLDALPLDRWRAKHARAAAGLKAT